MQDMASVTPREARERWLAIVDALVASGITPDVTTFVALMLGVDTLARTLGIEGVEPQKRVIGFSPSREQC